MSLYKEGILLVEFPVHARIGLKEAKSAYADRMAIGQEPPHCILLKMHGISLITDEAVEFMKSPEYTKTIKAIAVVADPESGFFEHGNNIMWVVKNIDKPNFNSEMFDNEDSALEWLRNYCNDPE